jgi:hypothetical protein
MFSRQEFFTDIKGTSYFGGREPQLISRDFFSMELFFFYDASKWGESYFLMYFLFINILK